MNRCVITGIGLVSPLGCGKEKVFRKLIMGGSGIKRLPDHMRAANMDVEAIGMVPSIDEDEDGFDEKSVFGRSMSKEMTRSTQFGIYAADMALKDAQLESCKALEKGDWDMKAFSPYDRTRVGIVMATGGVAALSDIANSYNIVESGSTRRLSPYFIPKILLNMTAGHISLRHGMQGPSLSASSACAASAHAIGDAYNLIRLGQADMMLAGGSEACINPLSIAGFGRMRALSTNTDIQSASRPFDKNRDGFVMGEGACVLVLENYEMAKARNAPMIAEIAGYGISSDAFHITSPSKDGSGAIRSMMMALNTAQLRPRDINYVNAHATSTPVGDQIEASAINNLVSGDPGNDKLIVSSTKGATGHLLGAAGAIETAFSALAVHTNTIPGTLNLEESDPPVEELSYVHLAKVGDGQGKVVKVAMSNSFDFGGTNASILLKKVE